MWAVVGAFGLESGLRAVRANLLCVRRAHRDVEGSVGVAEGGGEDVDESEVSARDEAADLELGGAVAGESGGVYHSGDLVVTGGPAHGTAAGVGET